MANILHISNSSYPSLAEMGPSRAIYEELAAGAERYHVLAQNVRRRFATFSDRNLTLHLVPAVSAREFLAWSYDAVPLVRRHGIRAIVCQDPFFGGPAAVAARRPFLAECHTDVYFAYARSRNPLERAAGRVALRVLRNATRVRVTGDAIAATLGAHGVRRDRMVLVPYRVDTKFFAPRDVPRAGPLVVSVGRFVEQKGYGPLIEAFARVVAELPEARLVLAGGGPLEGSLRETVERLGLGERVTLLGWVTREEQRDLLAAADVYAQPSVPGLGEWMPRTILEAMAMGRPVVARRVGGIADVVHDGENGRLLETGDDLAGALLALLADESLRTRLGARARSDAVELYAWDRSFELYREAISELSA